MKGLKVLIVTGVFPPDHGGPASYVPAIATALAQRHKILGIITLSNELNHEDYAYPFPVVRIRRRQNKLLRRIQVIKTIHKLASNADVVYLNGLVLEGIVACKIIGNKPVVIKVVGDLIWETARNKGITQDSIETFQTKFYNPKWNALKKFQSWCINQADIVITPSYFLAKIVQGWGVNCQKIKVIYNSVHSVPTAETVDRDSPVDCVTVGRMVPWKGVTELINVASRNQWKLNIVGDGSLREVFEDTVRKLQSNHLIKFVGSVPKAQVFSEISKAKIFILNSTYEGLPHIVLEAKSVGVPVIATAVGGTPETITDSVDGFLVLPGDNDALAQKIRFLLEHPEERQRIGLAGQKQVQEKFSFNVMVSETEQSLESVCKYY
jgi:glycosyltransferase involved in cell wall biosynthesis